MVILEFPVAFQFNRYSYQVVKCAGKSFFLTGVKLIETIEAKDR